MPNKTRKYKSRRNKNRKNRIGKQKGGTQLTVGELKQALEGVPENTPVWCVSFPSGYKAYGASYDQAENEFIIDF